MTQSLKIECLVTDLALEGEIASFLVTKEQLAAGLSKKADLVDGKIKDSNLPDFIATNFQTINQTISGVDQRISDGVQSAKDYAEAYTDDALTSKADLVGGKVPQSQLPSVSEYSGLSEALNGVLDQARRDMIERTDEIQRSKADLGEDGKVVREQLPNYDKIPGLETVVTDLYDSKANAVDVETSFKESQEQLDAHSLLLQSLGSILPYNPSNTYAEGYVTLKDGSLQQLISGNWVPFKINALNVVDASGETQQQVNYNGGSKWHYRDGGYQENERAVLDNGDIVKSTIDGNVNDPNANMTGWVKTNSTTQIYDDILELSQRQINQKQFDAVRWVTPQMFGAKGDGVADDSDAFKACVEYAVSQSFVPVIGSNRMLGVGIKIPATKGGYRIAQPRKFIPNLGTTRYLGLVIEGDGLPRIHFDYNGDDYLCYNNNQFLLLKFKNLDFSCNSDLSKFIYSTANGGAQDYSFDNCSWNGVWQKLFVLRGANNNSEWGWNKCGITCSIRDVMLDIADSDQFLNYWFNQCKIWLYDGQCVRASAGGHIKFLFCDWSGLQGTRDLCTSTKGKYLFEFTGSSHSRGVCDFRIIGGRFECKINSAGNGINARLLYCEWGYGNIELSFDASSTFQTIYDNEYSIHIASSNSAAPTLSIHDSFLIGKLKFESNTAAFNNRHIHVIKNTTFGSGGNLKKPTDFIDIVQPSINVGGSHAVVLENCRPSIANSMWDNTARISTAWDVVLGSRFSLSATGKTSFAEIKGTGAGNNPIGNNACYLQLPANSTVVSVKIYSDGSGNATSSTWVVSDDATSTALLTCAPHTLNTRWVEKSEIPYKSATGLLKLIDSAAANQSQATFGFKCIVEFVS